MNEMKATLKQERLNTQSIVVLPLPLNAPEIERASTTLYDDMLIAQTLAFIQASDSDSDKNRIASIALQIKDKLEDKPGIEAVWLEDLGKQINVYINTKDVRNATLDPIFDARLALNSEYPYISFDFALNPVDLEQKELDNLVQRLI
jgi:hypothetical protein